MAEVLAAVDCGTNSTRLLVSEGGTRTVERLMRITRLGQGVDATGALAPVAVERTLDVLRVRSGADVREHARVVRVDARAVETEDRALNPMQLERLYADFIAQQETQVDESQHAPTATQIFEALAVRDIQDAADILRVVYDRTNARDDSTRGAGRRR